VSFQLINLIDPKILGLTLIITAVSGANFCKLYEYNPDFYSI
jgi:hypothetical protein